MQAPPCQCSCQHAPKPACACPDSAPRPYYHNPKFQTFMAVLEKVSLLVLLGFSFYYTPQLCGYCAAGGFVVGIVYYWNSKPVKESNQAVGCSQGLLEQITGIRFPPPLGLAANVATLICHIKCHPPWFTSIVGFSFGLFVGKLGGEYIPQFYRQVRDACYQKKSLPSPV